MKIYTASSARCEWCQISRIEKGLIELGHEIVSTPGEADIIYQNNFWFDQIIKDKRQGLIKGKIALNILDLAPHLGDEFPLEKVKTQLPYADCVTCISEFVKADCLDRLDPDIKYNVIYQPIMDIFPEENNFKKYKYLFIGRVQDGNKRNLLAIQALNMIGAKEEEIICVGPEPIGFGDYYGVCSEQNLRKIMNSVDFVFCLGRSEGLSLVPWEAIASSYCIPIVCSDMSTANEFFKDDSFIIQPNAVNIAKFICSFGEKSEIRELANNNYTKYNSFITNNLTGKAVAQKILNSIMVKNSP